MTPLDFSWMEPAPASTFCLLVDMFDLSILLVCLSCLSVCVTCQCVSPVCLSVCPFVRLSVLLYCSSVCSVWLFVYLFCMSCLASRFCLCCASARVHVCQFLYFLVARTARAAREISIASKQNSIRKQEFSAGRQLNCKQQASTWQHNHILSWC